MNKATFKYITESDHPKHKLTIKNIKVFSVSKDLFTAFNEWHVQHPLPNPDELDTTITHCEFCGTKIAYAFPVTNIETKNTRIIGAKCLTYYSLNYQDGKLLTPKEAEKLYNKKISEIKEQRADPDGYALRQRKIEEIRQINHEANIRKAKRQQKFKEARLKREAKERKEREERRQEKETWAKIEAEFQKSTEEEQQRYANELLQFGKNREQWEKKYHDLKKTYGEKYQKEVAQIAKELFYKKK